LSRTLPQTPPPAAPAMAVPMMLGGKIRPTTPPAIAPRFAHVFPLLPRIFPCPLQTAFPNFLHSLTASAANASGFLQVSLSKILGNIDGFHPQHDSPRISDQR